MQVQGLATVEEARAELRISRTKVVELYMSGHLPSMTIGRRRFIPWSGIAEYIAEHTRDEVSRLSNGGTGEVFVDSADHS